MLVWLSVILGGIVAILCLNLWMERQANKELHKQYWELIKFALAKQDNAAYMTAYPLPNMDKVKQEEEQKHRREILEFNNIMLRDSVRDGVSEKEMKQFGVLESAGITS